MYYRMSKNHMNKLQFPAFPPHLHHLNWALIFNKTNMTPPLPIDTIEFLHFSPENQIKEANRP